MPFPLNVTLLLETLAPDQVVASVFEFPQCRVEAPSREEAIALLKRNFLERIAKVEALSWEVPVSEAIPNWLRFAGIFRDDDDFRAIVEALKVEYDSDDDSEVDPAYYA